MKVRRFRRELWQWQQTPRTYRARLLTCSPNPSPGLSKSSRSRHPIVPRDTRRARLPNHPYPTFSGVLGNSIGLHFGSLDFSRSLRHWVNDGLMTFSSLWSPLSSRESSCWASCGIRVWRRCLSPVPSRHDRSGVPLSCAHDGPTRGSWLGNRDGHGHSLRHRVPGALWLTYLAESSRFPRVFGNIR